MKCVLYFYISTLLLLLLLLLLKNIHGILRVFENRVLRRVFGRKRDQVKGECRSRQNEELYDLYAAFHQTFG